MRRIMFATAFVITLGVSLALAMVAAGQQGMEVPVTLTEFKVNMGSTSIPAGVPVTFTATNQGQMLHELILEKAGVVDQPFEMNGRETEIEDIAPGQTKGATWTITQPGEYQLACHLPGHYEAGMVQRFTVTAAAGSGQAQAGAQMQLAAPPAENQAEREGQPAANATMTMPQATPSTLPATGGSGGPSQIYWIVVAVIGLTAAVLAAVRWIVSQITIEQ